MYAETEGIVLKQVKISGGRRMITIFTKRYGKISAGTDINEKAKKRSSLSILPLVYGKYDLFKQRDTYYLNNGDVIRSHYEIGGDLDKYAHASYAVELADRLLPDEEPSPELFLLLSDYLDMIEKRKRKYETLTLAYVAKAIRASGHGPELRRCVLCGKTEPLCGFSVEDGGGVCAACKNGIYSQERLIFEGPFDIISILKFMLERPLASFEKLALDENTASVIDRILKSWLSYHLDISHLKSEAFLSGTGDVATLEPLVKKE